MTWHTHKTLPIKSGTCGAGDAARTRDIFLGKEVLYQLSYTRIVSIRGKNDASEAGRIKQYLKDASVEDWING
jgi:hypothetical protein